MQIEFLGTGGAITTPRPACNCRICVEARAKGLPYSRSGPSLFIHGPNILIDTPEEIKDQLNRSQVTDINGCFYSHWHPVLKSEATFQQTLDIVRRLDARRVIMTHIEEPDGLGYTDLQVLANRLAAQGLAISFAYDTLLVEV